MSEYKNSEFDPEDDGIEFMDDIDTTEIETTDIDTDDIDTDKTDTRDLDDYYYRSPSDYEGKSDSYESHTSKKAPARKNTSSSKDKGPTLVSELFSYVKIIVIAVVIAFIFTNFVIVNAQVPTGSMKNTIMEGDRLIGFRLAYTFSDPQRGDIVIFKFPDDETENYVKRIIGIPGDIIEIKEGHVYVNGELSPESYIREDMIDTGSEQTYVVPEDSYFMMGDNRNSSADSRFWKNTFVKRNKILAKVVFRYYDGENKGLDFSFIK